MGFNNRDVFIISDRRIQMDLTKEQREEFEEASRPLMGFLSDNFPNLKVIVDYSSSEILEVAGRFVTDDYVWDLRLI
jgi:hypothetical protein